MDTLIGFAVLAGCFASILVSFGVEVPKRVKIARAISVARLMVAFFGMYAECGR